MSDDSISNYNSAHYIKVAALSWWNTLRNTRLSNGTKDKGYFTDRHFGFNSRMWNYLSEEEIVAIWKSEFTHNS